MQKKIPLRMCLGCHEMKPKKELIRIVKNNEDLIQIDETGKKNGRGAYICNKLECLQKARKTKKLDRAFNKKIEDEIYDQLKKQMEDIDAT